MNALANEAVKLVKENLLPGDIIREVKVFFDNQKNNILLYLTAAMNMGEFLHDSTLDDNTNKMESPVSSLTQSIDAVFSNPVTGEEVKTPRQQDFPGMAGIIEMSRYYFTYFFPFITSFTHSHK